MFEQPGRECAMQIDLIWKEKKDRYKAKWVEWEAVADEMTLDELALNEHY